MVDVKMFGLNNSTGNLSDDVIVSRFTQPQWYIAEIYNFMMICTVTWLVIAISIYGVRSGKWRKKYDVTDANAGAVYTSLLCAFVFSYLRTISDQAAFNVGYGDVTSRACEVSMDVSVTGYSLTIIGVYTFLWLKQRSLYHHPAISFLCNPALKVVSWCSILIVWVGWVAAAFVYLLSDNYNSSHKGCITKPRNEYKVWPIYMSNGIIIVGQSLMLFLFIYPLRQSRSSANTDRISAIVKRSAIFAGICVLSDLISMIILAFLVPATTTRHVTITVYDVNLFINLLSLLLSFESWYSIITSPLRQTEKPSSPQRNQPTASGAQTAESQESRDAV
ncbi:uncharacterized protein LOC144747570 [Ciona intestinalis]